MGLFDVFTKKRAKPVKPTDSGMSVYNVTDQMLYNLDLAERVYSNNPPWLYEDEQALVSAGLGPLIAAEVARLITIESKISIANDKKLDGIYQRYVTPNLRVEVEKGWALGGLVFKPYYQNAAFELDANNQVVGISGKMKIAFVYPSQFLITGYDNSGTITEIMFFTTVEQDKRFYTLVEKQSYDELSMTLTITNNIYKTDSTPTRFKWDDLGNETVPMETVERWRNILPRIVFPNVQGTLIGFYKPALANNVNINSPYGLSGLVRAANSIRRADLTYNDLDWEMGASLARLYLDEVSLSVSENMPRKLARYIVKLLGSGEKRYFEKFSPEIREENYLNTYNAHLRQIEDIVGLAHGTLSKNEEVAKTATEIAMAKQRTYAMIVDNQKALEVALRQLAHAMSVWQNPREIAGEIEMSFDFDDSIVSSPAEQVQIMLQLQAAGNIPAYKTNMSYFNVPKTEAQKMVDEAKRGTFEDMDDDEEGEFE